MVRIYYYFDGTVNPGREVKMPPSPFPQNRKVPPPAPGRIQNIPKPKKKTTDEPPPSQYDPASPSRRDDYPRGDDAVVGRGRRVAAAKDENSDEVSNDGADEDADESSDDGPDIAVSVVFSSRSSYRGRHAGG